MLELELSIMCHSFLLMQIRQQIQTNLCRHMRVVCIASPVQNGDVFFGDTALVGFLTKSNITFFVCIYCFMQSIHLRFTNECVIVGACQLFPSPGCDVPTPCRRYSMDSVIVIKTGLDQ